jgi:hypothetical protein
MISVKDRRKASEVLNIELILLADLGFTSAGAFVRRELVLRVHRNVVCRVLYERLVRMFSPFTLYRNDRSRAVYIAVTNAAGGINPLRRGSSSAKDPAAASSQDRHARQSAPQ